MAIDQCGSVAYCDRRSLAGLCWAKYECPNKIPLDEDKFYQHKETGACVKTNKTLTDIYIKITKSQYYDWLNNQSKSELAKNPPVPLSGNVSRHGDA